MNISRASLTFLLLACLTLAHGQGVPPQPASTPDATTQLKAHGMPGESPVIQSILGAEFGATKTSAASPPEMAAALLQQTADRQRLDPAPAAASDAKAISRALGTGIQKEINTILENSTGHAAARATKPGDRVSGVLTDPPNGPVSSISNTALRMQAGVQVIGESEQFKRDSGNLMQGYRKVVQEVLVLAAIRAASSAVDSYTPDSVTGANVKEILSQILGTGATNIPYEISKTLGSYTLQDVQNAPVDVVADAIGEYANALKDNARASLDGQLKTYLTTGDGAGVLKSVSNIESQIDKSTAQMQTLSDALTDEATALGAQADPDTSVSPDLVVMAPDASSLWGQLSPDDKITALDEGVFSTKDVNVDALKSAAEVSAGVMDARSKAIGELQDVDALGKLAASLGVPVDTYNLSKNVETAETAINVAASIASGNWVGALSQGTALFGPASPDPTQLALSGISQKLDQVIGLQKQILDNLQTLSNQLQASTQDILASINDVKRMVNDVLYFEAEDSQKDLNYCEDFVTGAADQNQMVNGLYPTYTDRENHLADYFSRTEFQSCIDYLNNGDILDVHQRSGKAGKTFLSTLFLAIGPNNQPELDGYQNMLHHTLHMLGMTHLGDKPNCVTRMLWAASLGARYFSDVNISELSCGSQSSDIQESALNCNNKNYASDDGHECEKLRLTTTNAGIPGLQPADAPASLAISIVPENVQEVGGMVLFISPFMSLARVTEANTWIPLTPDELAKGKVVDRLHGRPENTAIYFWPIEFLDVVNIAIAQQSIASGSLITDATVQMMVQNQYGATAQFPPVYPSLDDPQKDKKMPKDQYATTQPQIQAMMAYNMSDPNNHTIAEDFPTAYNYYATLWLLKTNPTFAANFMRYFVTTRLSNNNVSRPEYQFALKSQNIHFIAEMLTDKATQDVPSLVYQTDASGKGWWHIALRQQDGSSYYLPLPASAVIWANSIAYQSPSDGLFNLRQDLLDRAVLAEPEFQKQDPGTLRLVNQEALGDPQLGQVRLDLASYYKRQCRATVCFADGSCLDPNAPNGRVCRSGKPQ